MAKFWLVFDGEEPTSDDSLAVLSVRECIQRLGLKPGHRLKLVDGKAPRFGNPDSKKDWHRGPTHVIVEITERDRAVGASDWPLGFYLVPTQPREVRAAT